MEKPLILGKQKYTFVKQRIRSDVAIYKNKSAFVRIGSQNNIEPEIAHLKKLHVLGFPIPKILSQGTKDGHWYFIEESFGKKHLGELFKSDILQNGTISETHFKQLLRVVTKYCEAQLHSPHPANKTTFAELVHLKQLQKELPQYKAKLQTVFDTHYNRIKHLPFVLTHGDFNPHNMYPKGLIDFEYASFGPIGYDLACALHHTNFFPKNKTMELSKAYSYSATQKKQFKKVCNEIFSKHNLGKFSDYYDSFAFFRAIWATTNMFKTPKIQQWRYNKFIKDYLS